MDGEQVAAIDLPVLAVAGAGADEGPFGHASDVLALHSGVVGQSLQEQGALIALPLSLVRDSGDVGLVWRGLSPGPVVEGGLQAVAGACQDGA
ncbi:hypothetical protein [Pseudorhodoferax sp. Leaf274]|uniref:hypothetical protein n=1 Tax=Pseudorhodoferax sp. Leaf274 TaxID=1736318 RepID=UPI00070279C1|nr:hypothetical protein [Pseudorhodoferax sp. Leaf274]KQP45591.1 hypothetical protein ASF44_25905 [Pseudorhodoferax sp. Leaf274]